MLIHLLQGKLFNLLNKYKIFNLLYLVIALISVNFFVKHLIGIYLFIGLFFLLIFIVNFFATKKIQKYIIIIFCSSFFSFYIFEFYLGFYLKPNNFKKYSEIIDIYNLNKPSSTIVSGGYLFLKKDNLNILPLSGISNKKTFLCNESGYYSSYTSDKYGFRNDNSFYDNDEYAILVGDSYAHGACVIDKDTIAGHLKKKNINTINLAYSSSGPLLQYAILREYADLKRAKKIYYFFYSGNDIYNDLKREKENHILKKYILDIKFSQNLKNKQVMLDNLYNDANEELISELSSFIYSESSLKNKLNCFVKLCKTRSPNQKPFYNSRVNLSEDYEFYFRILDKIRAYSESNGVEFIFIYIPNFYEFNFFSNIFYQFQYDKITKYLKEKKINFIDIKKEIILSKKKYIDFYPNKKFNHFNDLGYQFIAEQINKFNNKN